MTNYYKPKSIISLLLVLLFLTSCNGQSKTSTKTVEQIENISKPIGQTKLINKQGNKANDNVYCGLQDKAGNLWFGVTGAGVYRFDGKLFYNYTTNDGLSNNTVWSILEDRDGNIWFGTDNGISRFDASRMNGNGEQEKAIESIALPLTKENKNYSNNSANKSSTYKNSVWSMFQDKKGTIWFGTDEGLYCYDGKVFTRFLDNPNIISLAAYSLKNLQCMYEDKNGNMWFGSGFPAFEGIFRFDGNTIENFRPNNEDWIRIITEDKSGTLLFVTRHNGVQAYDGQKFTSYSQPLKLRNDLLNCIFVDKQKNIWYGSDYINDNDFTKGGVWMYDGKSFVDFTIYDGLTNTSPFLIMEDRAGNIWFGTRNTGLFKYDGKTFTNYSE
jgi:ligand-binding sensor domain-containing protein